MLQKTTILWKIDRVLAGLQEQHATVMYMDATMNQNSTKAGIGIVAKECNGNIITTQSIPCRCNGDAAILEALSIHTILGKAIEEDRTFILISVGCKLSKLSNWPSNYCFCTFLAHHLFYLIKLLNKSVCMNLALPSKKSI